MSFESSLIQKAGRAALWQIFGGIWQTLVRLGASVFLARVLKPSDFGLFGIAILVQEFLISIGAFGINTGIIAKRELLEKDLNTCFWMAAITRLLLFLVIFLCAPLFAIFFRDERLVLIIRIVSLGFLLQIIGVVPQAMLQKELNFKLINLFRGIAISLESFLAVILAVYFNLGYWSLVISLLLSILFFNMSIFFVSPWIPKFVFDAQSFSYFFRYGINCLGCSVNNYFKRNLDYFVVGRILGTYQLGLYEFAYRIPHLIFARISRPVGGVVFPALSKVQENNEKVFAGYVKTVKFISLLTFPMLFGLAALANILVPLLWGDQWLSIIRPLQILCFCAALRCIVQPVGSIFFCKDRPDLPFKASLIELIWTALVISIFGYFYGLVGVAAGMLLSVIPSLIVLYIAFRMIDATFWAFVRALSPIIFGAGICAISSCVVKRILINLNMEYIHILLMSVVTGVFFYLLFMVIFVRSLMEEAVTLLKVLLKN